MSGGKGARKRREARRYATLRDQHDQLLAAAVAVQNQHNPRSEAGDKLRQAIAATAEQVRQVLGGPGEPAAPAPRVKMVCAHCGSERVHADAYAGWDVDQQEWVLEQTFDKGHYCDDCDGECRLEEKPA